jgi:hypothetical protein
MAVNDIGYEGSPSLTDMYSTGSGATQIRADLTQIPQGLALTSAQTARVNKHQNQAQTAIVGVPGSLYNPHETDQIIPGVGNGCRIIIGNAPGAECVHLTTGTGNVIELGHDGSMKIVSSAGLHIGVSGEGHFVFQGAIHFVTSGDMHFKAGNMYFDTHNMNTIVGGSHHMDVHGDSSSRVTGDSHHTVQGDSSVTGGGSHRETYAGNHTSQVYGARFSHTVGPAEHSTADAYKVEAKNKMTHTSEGDMAQGTKANHVVVAEGNSTHDTKMKHTLRAESGIEHHSQDYITHKSKNAISHSSACSSISHTAKTDYTRHAGGKIQDTASQNINMDSGQDHVITASNHTVNANETITHAAQASIKVSTPITQSTISTGSTIGAIPGVAAQSPGQGGDPDKPNGVVEKTKTQAPEEKQIHKLVGDAVDSEFKLADIPNEQTIYTGYADADGGDPPEGIKKKMKEKGMEYDQYKQDAKSDSEDGAAEGGFNVADENQNWINTFT